MRINNSEMSKHFEKKDLFNRMWWQYRNVEIVEIVCERGFVDLQLKNWEGL